MSSWLERRQGLPCFVPFLCPSPGAGNGGAPGGGPGGGGPGTGGPGSGGGGWPGSGGGGWPGWPGWPGGGGGFKTTSTQKTEPTPPPPPQKEEPKPTKTTPKAQPAPTDTPGKQYTGPVQDSEPATTNRGSPGDGAGPGTTTTPKDNTPTGVVNAHNSDTFIGSQGVFTTIPSPPPGESGFPAPTGGDGDSHNSQNDFNSPWVSVIVSPSTTYTASRPHATVGVGPGGTSGSSNNDRPNNAGDSGGGGGGGGLASGAIAGIVIGLLFLLLLLALVLLRKTPFVQRMLAPLGLAQSPYGPTPGNSDGMGNSLLAGGAEAGAGAAGIAGAAGGAAVVGAAAAAAPSRPPKPPPQPMQQVGNQRGLTIPVAAAMASSNRWRSHAQPEPYVPSPVSPISESSILIPRVSPSQDPNPFPRRVSNRSLGAVSAISEVSAVSAGSILSPSSIPWPMPPGTPPLTPDGHSPIISPGGVQQAQLINFQQMGQTVVRISNPRSSRSYG